MYLRANAKINLALDVLGRRENGYHDVRMIMQTVGMYDRLKIEIDENEPGIRLTANLPYIPTDDHNLVVKAAKLLMEEKGIKSGLSIRLDKFIPVAAGLGGGSSDAAQTLIGVNRLFHLGYTKEELAVKGAAIGADVPYCVMQGTALSEGIGEILTPLAPMPDCSILLCRPQISVSTREIYAAIDAEEVTVHPDIDRMIRALKEGDLRTVTDPACMYNVLETVTAARYPVISEIEQVMTGCGALRSVMSGSGPTVFGVFDDREKAEHCCGVLKAARRSMRVFLTWPVF